MNDSAPIAFAAAVAIGSKILIRVPTGHGVRHCLNPSNTGIAVTLLVFPWVGIAPPYQFTENLSGVGDWLLPAVIIVSGTFLNTRFTYKVPLILGWLGGFLLQAVLRSQIQGTPLVAAVLPMTGMAFLLFTFYMVTDPATTPRAPLPQFAFGVAVAAVVCVLDDGSRGVRTVLFATDRLLAPRHGNDATGRRAALARDRTGKCPCRLGWRFRRRAARCRSSVVSRMTVAPPLEVAES